MIIREIMNKEMVRINHIAYNSLLAIICLLILSSGCTDELNKDDEAVQEKEEHAAVEFENNKTRNLVVITLDGVRWREVFQGAD
jgi:hypothetical protein